MLLTILLVSLAVVSADIKIYYAEETAEELFEDFIRTFNRDYTPEDKAKRLEIFKENLREINRLNTLDDAVFGINKFTDLSREEMRRYTGCTALNATDFINKCNYIRDEDITTSDAPESLDYRTMNAVTEIKDQGVCGSCWIFGTIGSMEGFYALKHGKLLTLSEQQLLDCLSCGSGCNGGNMVEAMSELVSSNGVMLDKDYPYTAEKDQCTFDEAREAVKLTSCVNFDLKNEDKLKEALYKYGPITIGVNAHQFSKYNGGIFTQASCAGENAGHAVLLIGYGTENGIDYWILKNSWGTDFGEEGYMRISRGENTCDLMNSAAASAMVD